MGIPNYISRFRERILWGGTFREKILVWLLSKYYRSFFLRSWGLGEVQPLYEFQRGEWFSLGFDKNPNSFPLYFARGFYASEVITKGNHILDIGCGDGFFSTRFYGMSGGVVDAIDIEAEAIKIAGRENFSENVKFQELNAVSDPFPRSSYDVVIWDGALAHFRPDDARRVLEKIKAVLGSGGVFMGSESLGRDDHGHFQFFDNENDLAEFLSSYFSSIYVRSLSYPINGGTAHRREVYWRCTNGEDSLSGFQWRKA